MARRKKRKVVEQRAHAKTRANQRYGIDLNSRDLQQIVALIKAGKSRAIVRYSLAKVVHAVEYAGRTMYPIYDKRNKSIATFLTPNMVAKEFGDELKQTEPVDLDVYVWQVLKRGQSKVK